MGPYVSRGKALYEWIRGESQKWETRRPIRFFDFEFGPSLFGCFLNASVLQRRASGCACRVEFYANLTPCPLIHHLHLSLLPTASPNKPSNSTMRPPSNSGVPTLNFLKPPSKPTKFRERKREKNTCAIGWRNCKERKKKKRRRIIIMIA
ncbi:hypothetical protein GBA52_020605 [Prunus armeniaca]|nr:hypothetical protein GBA52_020605 [Prunus armeniaca]